MSLSLIIPAYNEEKRIERTLSEVTSFFKKYDSFELIIACDGCSDATVEIVKKCMEQDNNIRLLESPEKLGKGGGIIEGFKNATGEIIGFMDADLSIKPEEFEKLIKAVESGADCAISSRRIKGSIISVKPSIRRRLASILFNFMIRLCTGLNIKDTQCGGKCFKKNVIKKVISDIKFKDYIFDVELLYKINKFGYTTMEIPIIWTHVDNGQFDYMGDGIKMGFDLLKIRFGE